MEKNKQGSKALEETEIGNLKPNKKEEVLEKIIKNDEQSRGGNYCTVQDTSIAVAEESKDSEFVLPSQQISESDFQSNFSFSSEHLSEVPVEYTLQPLVSDDELKDQVRVTLKEHLIGNTGQSAHVETHNQKMLPDGPSKLSLSPTSVPDNVSPGPSSALQERKLSPIENGNNPCLAEQDRQNSSPKLLSAPKLKISTDGYNWRKYGQKQVKSPEGSRSYYRCTFSDCNAKKIEFCDQFGNVIEIVYRNHHNHDPPQKVNCTRESRHTSSVLPANGSDNAAHPLRAINDYSVEKPVMEMAQIPETSQQETTNSDEIVEISTKEEHVNELEHKKRQKKSVTGDMVTITKPGKKPKTVVEEAGDVGISGDGYRWRKYGQKMVKGNLHPRNYYRCTSAGCPVRKHTERATDSSSAVIISYTGEHDHDMPVPKKTRGPTTDSLIATASPGPTNNLQINETESVTE